MSVNRSSDRSSAVVHVDSSSSSSAVPLLLSLPPPVVTAAMSAKATLVTVVPDHTFSLRARRLKDRTVAVYESGVNSFLAFCERNRFPIDSAHRADYYLAVYIQSLYSSGKPKSNASAALFGFLNRFPYMTKHHLRLSCNMMAAFDRVRPSHPHPPITWPVAVAIASVIARSGELPKAIAVLVMHHCLLRANETLNIRIADIALPHDHRLGLPSSSVRSTIRLAATKTGTNQSVTVEDDQVQQLLGYLIRGRPIDERVFDCSYEQMRASFQRACTTLHIDGWGITPHSCRHGGTTMLLLAGKSVRDIKVRGRWRSDQSVQRYIQQYEAALLTRQLPAAVHEAGAAVAADLARSIIRLWAASPMAPAAVRAAASALALSQ